MKFDNNFKSSLFFGVCQNVFISPLLFLTINPEETAPLDYFTEQPIFQKQEMRDKGHFPFTITEFGFKFYIFIYSYLDSSCFGTNTSLFFSDSSFGASNIDYSCSLCSYPSLDYSFLSSSSSFLFSSPSVCLYPSLSS